MTTLEARGFVLRRNWLPVVGSAALVVGGLLVTRVYAPWAAWGYLPAWFGVVFGPVCYLRNAFPRATPARIRATASTLEIEGRDALQVEDILEAKVVPRRSDAAVERALRDPSVAALVGGVGPGDPRSLAELLGAQAVVELALRDRTTLTLLTGGAEARALVQLLGARRTRFRLVPSFGRRFVVAFLFFTALFLYTSGSLAYWPFTIMSSLICATLASWVAGVMVRGRLVVGADGFTRRWLFWERFVAFRDVTSVAGVMRLGDSRVQDTSVVLDSGKRLRLRTIEAPNTEGERGAESAAMLAHLTEAFERSARLVEGSLDVPALVERGSRTAREWLSGIDALVRGGGSRYRVAAVSPDMLANLTHDPRANPEARVGAAAALIRIGDEALRTRVRVAAEGCAEPEVRGALLALADARDDEAVEGALAAMRR